MWLLSSKMDELRPGDGGSHVGHVRGPHLVVAADGQERGDADLGEPGGDVPAVQVAGHRAELAGSPHGEIRTGSEARPHRVLDTLRPSRQAAQVALVEDHHRGGVLHAVECAALLVIGERVLHLRG